MIAVAALCGFLLAGAILMGGIWIVLDMVENDSADMGKEGEG